MLYRRDELNGVRIIGMNYAQFTNNSEFNVTIHGSTTSITPFPTFSGNASELAQTQDDHARGLYRHAVVGRVIYNVVCLVYVVGAAWTIYALKHCRNIPSGVRLLLTGLLTFDMLYIVTRCLEEFLPHGGYFIYLTAFGYSWIVMSMLTLTMMSLDRYIAIRWPFAYEKRCTSGKTRTYVICTWLALYIVFNVCFIGICVIQNNGSTTCMKVAGFNLFVPVICIIVSTTCCIALIVKIKSKLKFQCSHLELKRRLNQDRRATQLVCTQLFFMWVELSLTEVVAGIMDFSTLEARTEAALRELFDAMLSVNCLIDVFVHVLWYQECRYQLVRSLSGLHKRFADLEYAMRNRLYDITPSRSASDDVNCDVIMDVHQEKCELDKLTDTHV